MLKYWYQNTSIKNLGGHKADPKNKVKKDEIGGHFFTMIRFAWFLFGFKFTSYKFEEVELILSFKNCIIQILMQEVVTILQFTRSD